MSPLPPPHSPLPPLFTVEGACNVDVNVRKNNRIDHSLLSMNCALPKPTFVVFFQTIGVNRCIAGVAGFFFQLNFLLSAYQRLVARAPVKGEPAWTVEERGYAKPPMLQFTSLPGRGIWSNSSKYRKSIVWTHSLNQFEEKPYSNIIIASLTKQKVKKKCKN